MTPIHNDQETQGLLEILLAGYVIEGVSLDCERGGFAVSLALHLHDGRTLVLDIADNVLHWSELGLIES